MICVACKTRTVCRNSVPSPARLTGDKIICEKKNFIREKRFVCPRCGSNYYSQEVLTKRVISDKGMDIYRKRKLKQVNHADNNADI